MFDFQLSARRAELARLLLVQQAKLDPRRRDGPWQNSPERLRLRLHPQNPFHSR